MSTKYNAPAIEAIQEDSEDDLRSARNTELSYRRKRTSSEATMTPMRPESSKGTERRRRAHRSAEGRRYHKSKGRTSQCQHEVLREEGDDAPPSRHDRSRSAHSSSSSDDEELVGDHRAVLDAVARARLTSPSTISSFTALTTTTNKSSGSSGSNSTITQSSVSKRSIGKTFKAEETPISPAVPDAPDVFAFLDTASTLDLSVTEDDTATIETDHHSEKDIEIDVEPEDSEPASRYHVGHEERAEASSQLCLTSTSSLSSSHSSENFSDNTGDIDTDRSTSPERSVKGFQEPEASVDAASVKIAAQIEAAQQRQAAHANKEAFKRDAFNTNWQRSFRPANPTPNLRWPEHSTRRISYQPETLSPTGYELLSLRLSHSEHGENIKPMYRKFEALNHRLLLHLQDEIGELEERLHHLDIADTQSRLADIDGTVIPASRRAAQAIGGDLQWHKTDVLGRIGFKLAQYSELYWTLGLQELTRIDQALAAFNTTKSLKSPNSRDVEAYREYLATEHPIAGPETHFLDRADDLVSVGSKKDSRPSSVLPVKPVQQPNPVKSEQVLENRLPGLATLIAVAVLIPVIIFTVIPGFFKRILVISLVASGIFGVLLQTGAIFRSALCKESLICLAIYSGVMVVIATIVA